LRPTTLESTPKPKQQCVPSPGTEPSTFGFTTGPNRQPPLEPEPQSEQSDFTQRVNTAAGTGTEPGSRLRSFSVSTTSTVSTSFKIGLDDVATPDVRDEVLSGFQELSIGSHASREQKHGKTRRKTTGIEDLDDGMQWGWSSGGADAERSAITREDGSGRTNCRRRPGSKDRKQVPGGPGRGSHGRQGHATEFTDSEEEERGGKGREHPHRDIGNSKTGDGRDAEIIMAIFNGTEKLGTSISMRMCMDEAGRWRIGWG